MAEASRCCSSDDSATGRWWAPSADEGRESSIYSIYCFLTAVLCLSMMFLYCCFRSCSCGTGGGVLLLMGCVTINVIIVLPLLVLSLLVLLGLCLRFYCCYCEYIVGVVLLLLGYSCIMVLC